jgi:hypothetical protein
MRANGLDKDSGEDDWRELAQAVQRNRVSAARPSRLRWLGVFGLIVLVIAMAAGALWVLVHRGVVHVPEKKWVPSIYRTR